MTIAAGIVCSDGVVLCADSQESYGPYKWPVQKLLINQRYGFPLMIAGSGLGPAIDNATQRIVARLQGGFRDIRVIEEHIQSILRDIYANDIAHYPVSRIEDAYFDLLIAFRVENHLPRLYKTSGSLLQQVKHFAIVGSGEVVTSFAHTLYKKGPFGSLTVPLSMGRTLAVYLAYLAKTQLSSVGGRSELATVDNDGEIAYAKLWEAPQWERFFGQYERLQGDLMLAAANPSVTAEYFAKKVAEFSTAVMKQKAQLLEETREWEELFAPYPGDGTEEGS